MYVKIFFGELSRVTPHFRRHPVVAAEAQHRLAKGCHVARFDQKAVIAVRYGLLTPRGVRGDLPQDIASSVARGVPSR